MVVLATSSSASALRSAVHVTDDEVAPRRFSPGWRAVRAGGCVRRPVPMLDHLDAGGLPHSLSNVSPLQTI